MAPSSPSMASPRETVCSSRATDLVSLRGMPCASWRARARGAASQRPSCFSCAACHHSVTSSTSRLSM
eukprot:3199096-Pyramimonas_sp.AAC.1